MKTEKRLDAFERLIMTALANGEREQRRIVALEARVAEMERLLAEMRKSAPLSDDVLDTEWAPCTQPGVAAVDWSCERCGRTIPAGARHICNGTWWYSDAAPRNLGVHDLAEIYKEEAAK